MIYDTAVIGTGPSGLSAALNLKIRNKNFIWIGSRTFSDKVSKAECISNYPGLTHVTGKELAAAFDAQVQAMDLKITEQMVNSIVPVSGHYALMAGSEFYESQTLILATGTGMNAILPGESEFLGRGVSYCATCDGNLYHGRTIAVICTSRRFEPEAAFLASVAGKVYFFPAYHGTALHTENIEQPFSPIAGIIGDSRVTGICLKDGTVLKTEGVFCLRDAIAYTALLPNLKTEDGLIRVDRTMATNLPGVYAAGDCTGRPYQYAKAVGEGNVAAHSVLTYLSAVRSNTDTGI